VVELFDHLEGRSHLLGMKVRRRLGVLTTAVSGLLAAGLLFSAPAFAWDTDLTDVSTSCPPDSEQSRVDFTLKLFEKGHSGHIEVAFKTDKGDWQKVPDDSLFNEADEADSSFGPDDLELKLHFPVSSPGDEGSNIKLHTTTFFDDSEEAPESFGESELKQCAPQESSSSSSSSSTSTTEAPSSTEASSSTEAPSSIGAPRTSVVAMVPSAPRLPRTGSSTVPMLIAALFMIAGGGAILLAARVRGRQAGK
jgi:LPXTG-motif cell wall-anchored protein